MLYSPLRLSECVFEVVLHAHKTVLAHGLDTGNERVIVIDKETGEILYDHTDNSPHGVSFEIPNDYNGYVITIHNHPKDNPFSTLDIFTLMDIPVNECSVIQAHNGKVYMLRKLEIAKYDLDKLYFDDLFYEFIDLEENGAKSFPVQQKDFIDVIAKLFSLEYREVD